MSGMIAMEPTVCTYCGPAPVVHLYSFDMDLPGLPFCNEVCVFLWEQAAKFECGHPAEGGNVIKRRSGARDCRACLRSKRAAGGVR